MLSMADNTLSPDWNPTEAPSFKVLKSEPSVVPSAVVLILPILLSTYALLAASVFSVGVCKPFTLVVNTFAYFCAGAPILKVFVVVGIILLFTDAPKLITSPPSPRLIVLPLSMIAPFTFRLFLIDILFAWRCVLLAWITPCFTVKPLLKNARSVSIVKDVFATRLAASKLEVFNVCVLRVPMITFWITPSISVSFVIVIVSPVSDKFRLPSLIVSPERKRVLNLLPGEPKS